MSEARTRLIDWFSARFPWQRALKEHLTEYYAPKNFNFWYFFGSLAMLVFANQIISGIWLVMYYTPSAQDAFTSIEYIMRDVNYGWLIRYLHSTGASAFFVVIYLHIFRSLLYGSYQSPRELVWLLGATLYLAMMAEAFFGYLLPWGQMSYWGAQVITSLFGAIPVIGPKLLLWLRGDYNVADATLHRFFALHVIAVPMFMMLLVFLHLVALHKVGSNNPDGVDIKKHLNKKGIPLDGIPFHPYYVVKDIFGAVIFLIVFLSVVFWFPTGGGFFLEHANYIPADPLLTPDYIAPVWYLTPFYSILRAVPDKLFGVMAMGAAIALIFVLPWLDKSPVRSIRYRNRYCKFALAVFAITFIGLGILGVMVVTQPRLIAARVFSVLYFAFFLLMPIYSKLPGYKQPPKRLT